jgi:hypothetical protein
MLRLGLLLYDLLALRGSLPRSRSVARGDPARAPLKDGANRPLLAYFDAWADDARLVALNALDAAERSAEIATRTEFLSARREGGSWRASLSGGRKVTAALIVNAAGPWVAEVLGRRIGEESDARARLVRGSHIVVPALWDGEDAYILQQGDGRVVFALPFEGAADPAAWAALVTLIVMEVVLGIDNLIFISILSNKLPEASAQKARRIGIGLALIMRLALLSMIAWLVGLTAPVFDLGLTGPLRRARRAELRDGLLLARPHPDRRRPVPGLEGDQGDPPHRRSGAERRRASTRRVAR